MKRIRKCHSIGPSRAAPTSSTRGQHGGCAWYCEGEIEQGVRGRGERRIQHPGQQDRWTSPDTLDEVRAVQRGHVGLFLFGKEQTIPARRVIMIMVENVHNGPLPLQVSDGYRQLQGAEVDEDVR